MFQKAAPPTKQARDEALAAKLQSIEGDRDRALENLRSATQSIGERSTADLEAARSAAREADRAALRAFVAFARATLRPLVDRWTKEPSREGAREIAAAVRECRAIEARDVGLTGRSRTCTADVLCFLFVETAVSRSPAILDRFARYGQVDLEPLLAAIAGVERAVDSAPALEVALRELESVIAKVEHYYATSGAAVSLPETLIARWRVVLEHDPDSLRAFDAQHRSA